MTGVVLTVIIPAYNAEKYLPQCLDSVIGQTLKDIEVICVDDGSTDGSASVLQAYTQKDSRISVLTQGNSGQSAARNRALEKAKGAYVQFLDADDWLDPDCCRVLSGQAAAGKKTAGFFPPSIIRFACTGASEKNTKKNFFTKPNAFLPNFPRPAAGWCRNRGAILFIVCCCHRTTFVSACFVCCRKKHMRRKWASGFWD